MTSQHSSHLSAFSLLVAGGTADATLAGEFTHFHDPPTWIALSLDALLVLCIIAYLFRRYLSGAMAGGRSVYECLACAILGGLFGCWSSTVTKLVVTGLKNAATGSESGIMSSYPIYLCIIGLFSALTLQLGFLNAALKRYDALTAVPPYECTITLGGVAYGWLFLGEASGVSADALAGFLCGCAMCCAGVVMLSSKARLLAWAPSSAALKANLLHCVGAGAAWEMLDEETTGISRATSGGGRGSSRDNSAGSSSAPGATSAGISRGATNGAGAVVEEFPSGNSPRLGGRRVGGGDPPSLSRGISLPTITPIKLPPASVDRSTSGGSGSSNNTVNYGGSGGGNISSNAVNYSGNGGGNSSSNAISSTTGSSVHRHSLTHGGGATSSISSSGNSPPFPSRDRVGSLRRAISSGVAAVTGSSSSRHIVEEGEDDHALSVVLEGRLEQGVTVGGLTLPTYQGGVGIIGSSKKGYTKPLLTSTAE